MKIDGHQHFWKFDKQRYGWIDDSMAVIQKDFLPKDLKTILHKNNFSGCVAVQADQSIKETEFLLDLASKNDFIKAVVGWVDLSSEDVESDLQRFINHFKFRGVRHTHYDEKGEFMQNEDFLRGVAKLKDYDLTYDILAFDYQLKGAVKLVQSLPEQDFVLDHMGKPKISKGVTEDWKTCIHNLAENPKVYCKISGLVTETKNFQWEVKDFYPFLDVVVDAFGVDRLIFGSDWPVCLTAATNEQVVQIIESYFSDFGNDSKLKIFGKNACKFYKLKETSF